MQLNHNTSVNGDPDRRKVQGDIAAGLLIEAAANGLQDEIADLLSTPASGVCRIVLGNVLSRPNTAFVGQHFGSLRRLERRFAAWRLPSPKRLVVLCRWLPVGRALASNCVRTSDVAAVLRFTSTQALCKAAIREVHVSTRSMREFGAIERGVRDMLTAYGRGNSGRAFNVTQDDH